MSSFSVSGMLVDIHRRKIFPATINVANGKVSSIVEGEDPAKFPPHFIMPGFVDAHVHIESSMLVPAEFARLAVVHGTVATVSDPHEIANVCGMEGVDYMIRNGQKVPFKFYFGAPSCVPATHFETAGARLGPEQVRSLLERKEIRYLSEMMNFPGVIHGDEEVLQKIRYAKELGKPVDGHAPALRGPDLLKYIQAGISTDHECYTEEEAAEKLSQGMKIIIREGSAARNFEALIGLLKDHSENMMFCSDDKHPDSLELGHIDQLCARAVEKGVGVWNILEAACKNPVEHYNLEVGLLRVGDPADFILVEDLKRFRVFKTFINGVLVAENGRTFINSSDNEVINHFECRKKSISEFQYPAVADSYPYPVIEALDGQLITHKLDLQPKKEDGNWVSDVDTDILKIVVVNRYENAAITKAFIKNFGLKDGALASSVAHDSHNIVAVGTDDESLCKAVNMVIDHKGGVSLVTENKELSVPLPVAGLMSTEDGYHVAKQYAMIDNAAKEAGSGLAAPFMTLSFMALLVIPRLKLSDKGLFDGDAFKLLH